jgi:hypothetical protein
MRIWSISLEYLDSKRLGAQWREALLCRNVLLGLTKGYKNHPQFTRIQQHQQPLDFINTFLYEVHREATNRGYKYDEKKLQPVKLLMKMDVTEKQLEYEFSHIQLKIKNSKNHIKFITNRFSYDEFGLSSGQLFNVIPGDIMDFEKTKQETLDFKDGNI